MLIYLLSALGRSNIVSSSLVTLTLYAACNSPRQGNAKLLNSNVGDSLVQTAHLTDRQYLVALLMFIVAYTIFEVPSNYMLKKFRPSRWYADNPLLVPKLTLES